MESIVIASTKDIHLRSLMSAIKGTRAERYPILHGKVFRNPALIASGSDLMFHDAYMSTRLLREIHQDSLCIGIQDGIIKVLQRLFITSGIVFILPDGTEVITQVPLIELRYADLNPRKAEGDSFYFSWSQLNNEESPESYRKHDSTYTRMESLIAGFKAALGQVAWNAFQSSPPQSLQSTAQ